MKVPPKRSIVPIGKKIAAQQIRAAKEAAEQQEKLNPQPFKRDPVNGPLLSESQSNIQREPNVDEA